MEEIEVKEELKLPPGFRFHPTHEELITFYLVNKISYANFTATAIGDVDLNKCQPWELPGKAKMGEKEWYFFSLRDRKYPTGVRTNRATKTGYWKTTGKDKEIYNSSSNTSELVGMKKTLVFYRGRAPRGEKSCWVMHEYRLNSKSAYTTTTKPDEWVVCRVFQKCIEGKKYVSNHSRAVNPYTYNLEIAENSMQSQVMQPETFQFPMARNCMTPAEIQELNKVFRGDSQSGISLSIPPPHINCCIGSRSGGGGGSTISGLNLNTGGVSILSQPFMTPIPQLPPPPGMNQQNGNASMLTVGGATASDQAVNYGGDMNNRFMGIEHCADLENYWSMY